MNEAELLKSLIANGPIGLVCVVLWLISKRYQDAHQTQVGINQEVQNKRIDALEKGNEECQRERKELQRQIIEIVQDHPSEVHRLPSAISPSPTPRL